MDQVTISAKQVRLLIIVGSALLGGFMLADLALLPKSLHGLYLTFRIGFQLPVCIIFLLSTFLPNFLRIYQPILFSVMLLLIYLNLGLILWCWELMYYAFPYEGTILYSLFALFIFRMNFKYGLVFSGVIIVGFASLLLIYPVYADKNSVNIGFVFVGLLVGLLGVYRLEVASKENQEKTLQLIRLNQTDLLTGILNRGTYETRFQDLLELIKRHGNRVCVYFIDLDYFKDYNDGHGHPQGDKIIQKQARMLEDIFQRSTDIVARYGGEEFLVVTSNVDQVQSKDFADKIINKWSEAKEPHAKGKAGEFVSCSVGYHHEIVDENSTVTDLVKKADEALYKAKAAGRGCAVLFEK